MSVSRTVVSATGRSDSAPPAEVPSQAPLVLVIEDDVCVADVVAHLLTRNGNRVLRARDGAEGAQCFAANERDVALVIVDCGLPDIDGVALARVLRRIAPNLPIILTSGWETAAARTMAGEGPTHFMQKPFLPADVTQAVNTLLAKKV